MLNAQAVQTDLEVFYDHNRIENRFCMLGLGNQMLHCTWCIYSRCFFILSFIRPVDNKISLSVENETFKTCVLQQSQKYAALDDQVWPFPQNLPRYQI